MIDYGRHSETERVLVHNDGLINQSELKIQSGHCRNAVELPFDGDEMNMHMPQNELSETELRHLAAIPYQIISPSSNAPIIGIYQDSMLGSYQFTREGVEFTPRQAMNLLMGYTNVDMKDLKGKNKITNFDILSQITPPISLKYKTKLFEDGEDASVSNNVLEITNGKYIRGQADKGVFASGTKGILNRVCNDFGNMACSNYIDDLQQVITEYMKTSAYSVGISDLMSNQKTTEKVLQVISSKMNDVKEITDKVHLGILENNSGKTNAQEFEIQVGNILNDATSQTGKIGVKSLDANNRFVTIVKSGSKGSMLNISQMISCLGQQSIDGKRVPYGFDNRTLPHFKKYDDSPEARGFVKNSYISGLTAPELFFHAMGGRMGLIDTAVKTSQTGYIQRRLVKGLEDLKVEYDGTVRNNMGKIVQFVYGDDGVDTTRVENQSIPLVNMSIEDIYMYYDLIGINEGENKELLNIYTKETIRRIKAQLAETKTMCKNNIETLIKNRDEIVEKVFKYKNEDGVKAPIAFQYIIQNIQGQLNLLPTSAVDITPMEFFEMCNETMNKLKLMFKPTRMFEIMFQYYLSPKEILIKKRFNRTAVALLMENIILTYKKSVVHPGEMVGVIAGQSIGEPTTQLTLNSFVYETEILVRNSAGEIKCVQIGDFTKWGIASSRKLDYMEDKDTTYAELSEYYEVPSATEDGETVWRRIEAVTKHPVINEDGTNTMLKVTTKGCRELIATKAKSFLKLVDGKIVGIEGKDLKVGDYLPVSKKALVYTEKTHLDLRTILAPSKYIYGSEMLKAKSVVNEYQWWMKHSDKSFVLPYSRSDSAYKALTNPSDKVVYEPGYVYTKTNSICNYKIPELLDLDYDFGYLIGAYCAEGCMTKHQISIANNDDEYLKRIENWCAKHNLTTKIYINKDKIQDGWTSQDIRIYSTVLCNIIENLCGKLSHNKYVSDKIIFSNRECVMGFLDAYIGGDGCVKLNKGKIESIEVSSVSHKLLTGVQLMLKNHGVISKIHKPKKIESNNRGSLDIKQCYLLTVRNGQSIQLAQMLNLPIQSKRNRIFQLLEQTFKYDYCKSDLKIPNEVNGEIIMELRDGRCEDLEFDKIVSIEEVSNTTDYAYDLTVEDTRNFDCMNGLCVRDTFHLAGVATKSNVTRGVPRIEEILRLTRNPDKPSATVYLKPIDQHDKDKATNYCNMIQHTKLIDVVKSVEICFDPNDKNTKIIKDQDLISQFYDFEEFIGECGEGKASEVPKSKWIVRMEIDTESLLDKNITMDDIHYAISASHGNDVSCVFSDMNSSNLVFRIRINASVFNKGKKKGVTESLDQSDEIYLLKNFQDNLLNNIVLRGVNGITNVNPRMLKDMLVKEDSKFVRKDMWVLDTVGTNLQDLFMLDFIDYARTYSNDIREIYNTLGIEATRQNILNEFNEVMEASDAYVNYHHLSILCDRMTVKADLVPMFRSGIMNDDIGPISKGTYEMHTEMFLDASRHGDFDQMRGVSANVMCGQTGFYGTSAFSLLLDMNAIKELDDSEVVDEDLRKNIDEHFVVANEDTKCDMKKINIDNNVKNLKATDMGDCNDAYSLF
jgi:DNA-directed RNA polymerase beta' subunit